MFLRSACIVFLFFLMAISFACPQQQTVAAKNRYKVAKNFFTQGRYAEAEKELAESLRLDARFSDALFLMALTKWQSGDLNEAQKYIEQVLRQEPKYIVARLYYASILMARNELPKAEEQIKFYISNAPSDPEGYYAQGVILYKKGKVEKAVEQWNKAISLDKNHVYSYFNRGIAFEILGKYKEAIDSVSKALALKSNNSNKYRFALAVLHYKYGKKEDAVKDFKYLSELIPSSSEGLVSAAYLALDSGNWEEALAKAEAAFKRDPEFTEALYVKGMALSGLEQFDKGVEALELLLKKDPNRSKLKSEIQSMKDKIENSSEDSPMTKQENLKSDSK